MAIEKPVINLVAKFIPLVNFETIFGKRSYAFQGAARLNMLPVPKRPRPQPFDDELPALPLAPSAAPALLTAGVLAAIFYLSTLALNLHPSTISMTPESTFAGRPLLRDITANPAIDQFLSVGFVVFAEGVAGADPFQRIQVGYFLLTLLPLLYVWTVEAYRNGNYLRPFVTLPVLFTAAAQLVGFGKVAPLYFLLSVAFTSTTKFGRPIPSPVAKALLPATLLGFLLPSVLMLLPRAAGDTSGMSAQLALASLWQPSPIYVAILTWTLAKAIELTSAKPVTPLHLEVLETKDLAPLKMGYTAVITVMALMHAAVVWWASAPEAMARLLDAFFGLPAPAAVEMAGAAGDLYGFFKWDFVLTAAAMLVWSLYSVFELRRAGYVTTATAGRAGVAVLAGQVVVGPGATYAGLAAWREHVIASIGVNLE